MEMQVSGSGVLDIALIYQKNQIQSPNGIGPNVTPGSWDFFCRLEIYTWISAGSGGM